MVSAVWALVLWFVLGYLITAGLWVATVGASALTAIANDHNNNGAKLGGLVFGVGVLITASAAILTSVNVIIQIITIIQLAANGS